MSFIIFPQKLQSSATWGCTAYLNDSVPDFLWKLCERFEPIKRSHIFSVIGSAAFQEDRQEVYSHPLHLQPCRTHSALSTTSTFSSIQRGSRFTSQVSRTRFPTMEQNNMGAVEESRGLFAFFFSKALVQTANKDPLQRQEFSSPDFHEVRSMRKSS